MMPVNSPSMRSGLGRSSPAAPRAPRSPNYVKPPTYSPPKSPANVNAPPPANVNAPPRIPPGARAASRAARAARLLGRASPLGLIAGAVAVYITAPRLDPRFEQSEYPTAWLVSGVTKSYPSSNYNRSYQGPVFKTHKSYLHKNHYAEQKWWGDQREYDETKMWVDLTAVYPPGVTVDPLTPGKVVIVPAGAPDTIPPPWLTPTPATSPPPRTPPYRNPGDPPPRPRPAPRPAPAPGTPPGWRHDPNKTRNPKPRKKPNTSTNNPPVIRFEYNGETATPPVAASNPGRSSGGTERKIRSKIVNILMWGIDSGSEWADLWEILLEQTGLDKKDLSFAEQLDRMFLEGEILNMDPYEYFKAVAANYIEDSIIGRIHGLGTTPTGFGQATNGYTGS